MTAAIHGLLIGVLFFGGTRTGEQSSDAGQEGMQANGVKLTNTRPEASFPVPAATLASSPPVLALHFTQVTNPSETPFQIFVFLSYRPAEEGVAGPVRVLLGNGALYPPDRPGGLIMRASSAFRQLKAAKGMDVKLVLEMKRLHPQTPWSPVEVTVAPPEWRSEHPPQSPPDLR
ncbi:MAG TPA: hypothetical protein VMT20_03805 [Terriglobia bacterium]|nr:hypothetical protein [Terriglobia bacterium]